jgi:hypothetical protein
MTISTSIFKRVALLTGIALNLGLVFLGGATRANAQVTYACPPGYYFLANYGCYPFGGYTTYAPPPAYAYYPAYPSYPYAYYPQFGFNFRFGDRDHDFRRR